MPGRSHNQEKKKKEERLLEYLEYATSEKSGKYDPSWARKGKPAHGESNRNECDGYFHTLTWRSSNGQYQACLQYGKRELFGNEQCFGTRKPTLERVMRRFKAIHLGEEDMNDDEGWVTDSETADHEPQEVKLEPKSKRSRNKLRPVQTIEQLKKANIKKAKKQITSAKPE